MLNENKPSHDKTNKMACTPSEDSDQTGRMPSLIRIFAVGTKKAWVLSYPLSAQQRLWSDWVDAQADLSLFGRTFILLVLSWGGSNGLCYCNYQCFERRDLPPGIRQLRKFCVQFPTHVSLFSVKNPLDRHSIFHRISAKISRQGTSNPTPVPRCSDKFPRVEIIWISNPQVIPHNSPSWGKHWQVYIWWCLRIHTKFSLFFCGFCLDTSTVPKQEWFWLKLSPFTRNKNKKLGPLRAMKIFIRKKMGHTT